MPQERLEYAWPEGRDIEATGFVLLLREFKELHAASSDLLGPVRKALDGLAARYRAGAAILYQHGDTTEVITSAHAPEFTPNVRVEIGCMAKTVTAMLVAVAVRDRRLAMADRVGDLLGSASESRHAWRGLRLTHLLNHTHGLDVPRFAALPRRTDGFIDVSELEGAVLRTRPLAEPGELFDYSDIGYWLTAAILEACYGKPFSRLLHEKLFEPAGIPEFPHDVEPICPSIGRGLYLSASDLMKLARVQDLAQGEHPTVIDQLMHWCEVDGRSVPRWPPLGSRVGAGWSRFDAAFGYSGKGRRGSALIRVLPEPRSIVVITAGHEQLAKQVLSQAFAAPIAEQPGLPPALLPPEAWQGADPGPYCGTYENGRYSVVVDLGAHRALRMRVWRKDSQGALERSLFLKRYLKAAEDAHFHPQTVEPLLFPILHFIVPENGLFRYLRTGLQVFRRVIHA